MSCEENNLSITELRRREHLAKQCAMYRTRINQKCFAGGDMGHRKAEKGAWRTYEKCANKILEKKWKK